MPHQEGSSQNVQSTEDLEPIDFDALLPELGKFGRYQKFVFFYLVLAIIFTSMHSTQFIFNAGSVAYRCRVPQCEASPARFVTDGWNKFALPTYGYDCLQNIPIGKQCEPASFSNDTTRCYSWVYESYTTIVSEFDLACAEWKRTLVGTIHNAGVFVAVPTTAAFSDTYGRRMVLIGTSVAPAVVGVCRAHCQSYILYLVLEFLEALVGNCTYSTAFIIALEIVDVKRRVLGGNILQCTYALGQVTSAVTAWLLPYWRTYTLAIFSPCFFFIFYYFFVEESVRWLITTGNRDEAVRIIYKIARVNGTTLSTQTVRLLNEGQTRRNVLFMHVYSRSYVKPKPEPLIKQVLASKIIITRMVVISFWWVSTTTIYYGLSFNAVSLFGNKYLNYILTSLAEIPGSLLALVTLDRFGRKSTIMTGYFICGIALLVLPLVRNSTSILLLTLVGKMMSSLIYCGIYIYTIELFPTQARHVLLGFCSMTGRIGSMSAPQTPLLMVYHKYLPYLLFGTLAGFAGLLMLFTPETLHMKLPNTIREAEQMSMLARNPRRKATDLLS